jgi:hypothetical protein
LELSSFKLLLFKFFGDLKRGEEPEKAYNFFKEFEFGVAFKVILDGE